MNEILDDAQSLADHAAALLESASDQAGKSAGDARRFAGHALEQGKEAFGTARRRAMKAGRAADSAIHGNPYQGILVGMGIGLALGYLASCHCQANSD